MKTKTTNCRLHALRRFSRRHPANRLGLAAALALAGGLSTAWADDLTTAKPAPPRLSVLMGLTDGWQQDSQTARTRRSFLLDLDAERNFDAGDSFSAFKAAEPIPATPGQQAGQATPVVLPETARPADYAASGFAPAVGSALIPHHGFNTDLLPAPARSAAPGFTEPFGGVETRGVAASLPVVNTPATAVPVQITATTMSGAAHAWGLDQQSRVGRGQAKEVVPIVSTPAAIEGGFGNSVALPDASVTSINKIADTTTTGPGQSSAFTSFGSNPYVSNNRVAFIGTTTTPKGVYVGTVVSGGTSTVQRVADYSIPVPNLGGTFSNFGASAAVGNTGSVVFQGTASGGGSGIYIGTGGNATVQRVADTTMTAPGRGTLFTGFGTTPGISGTTVAFTGTAAAGSGVYVGTAGNTSPILVADTTFTAPGKGAAFSLLSAPAISGNSVVFVGTASSTTGFYSSTIGSGVVVRLADTTTAVPGQSGVNFTNFAQNVSVSGNKAVVNANFGTSSSGVFSVNTDGSLLARVADTTQNAPGKGTLFTGFSSPSISNGNVAFLGTYGSSSSIFVALADGSFLDVVDSGSAFGGSTFSSFALSKYAFFDNQVSFTYTLANGVQGVGEADLALVPEPATWAGGLGLLGAGILGLRRRARRTE